MSDRREIVFFKVGEFSHVNENVTAFLRAQFPEHRLVVIDVLSELLQRRPLDWLRAFAEVLIIYPRQIFLHRRKPTDFLLRTPAAFRAIKQAAAALIDPARTAFTFQTQSLFDASRPEVPHFVYTDHACLANRRYARLIDPELLDARWLAVEKSVYESARVTFTTGTFAETSLIEDYGLAPERTACVFSGTNVRATAEAGSRPFKGVVLFVGVDWLRKGGHDLVTAFTRIAEIHPQARLRIVGCSPAIDHPRIETLGKLSLEETAAQFRDADIFCLPSYHEPSAVALVEAQLHGLPVITTNVGGSPDRLIDGETGHLVAAGDIDGLAAALDRLLANPARCREMGEAGRRFAAGRFSWESVGSRVAERIRTALEVVPNRSEDSTNRRSGNSRKEIIFFKVGSNSQKNPFIARELERGFPECSVRVVDVVRDIVLRSPVSSIAALAEVLWGRGPGIIARRENPLDHFPPTVATYRAIQAWIHTHVKPSDTLFTFANQSHFDASGAGVPHFVYTDHTHLANGHYPGQPFSPNACWLERERLIYERVIACFTTSSFARDSLLSDYGLSPEKVYCVYSGTNAVRLPALAERTSFHQRVLFVGVEWERKGGPKLIEAWAQVRRQFPAAELWIVGCAAKISGCSPKVTGMRVFGRVPCAELGAIFAQADIFCLPSRKDPSAIALAEAANAGLPVVATRVGGSADRVIDGETGYLVAPGDSEALAERLIELLGNPARCREMGARGFALAQERFTWTAVGDRLTRLIRENLAKGLAAASHA